MEGKDTCAQVSGGTLKIIARQSGTEVLSVRMNTARSWTYGYFEARLKLPAGKGTWPAFWMMPKNFTAWPDDGEIDIMEEVGYRPNYVSSSIHCKAYNHSIGTQKTAENILPRPSLNFMCMPLNGLKTIYSGTSTESVTLLSRTIKRAFTIPGLSINRFI